MNQDDTETYSPSDRAELRAALAATDPADCDPATRRMAETWLDGPQDMPLDEDRT